LLKEFRLRLCHLKEVRSLYEEGHYLHRVRVGRQLNYAIEKDGILYGAICFALPMMRNGYLGFTSTQMVEFARLYLTENVPGLAVYSIGVALRLIRKDWIVAFPSAEIPLVVVSWHDTWMHLGTVYKAANFEFYKNTARPRKRGMRRDKWPGVRELTPDYTHVKGIWLYPLPPTSRKSLRDRIVSSGV
jgi:hypothetical protein